MNDTAKARRGRPRKVESYADWMARIDAEVESLAAGMGATRKASEYIKLTQKLLEALAEALALAASRAPQQITDAEYDRRTRAEIVRLAVMGFVCYDDEAEYTRMTQVLKAGPQ
jgi:hypothetical protein